MKNIKKREQLNRDKGRLEFSSTYQNNQQRSGYVQSLWKGLVRDNTIEYCVCWLFVWEQVGELWVLH